MIKRHITALLQLLRPSFLGLDDGGASDAASQQRADEQTRQRNIDQAIARINETFDGKKQGVGAVNPGTLKVGSTYYDANGNPVTYNGPPTPTPRYVRTLDPGKEMNYALAGRDSQGSYYVDKTQPYQAVSAPQMFSDVSTTGGFGTDYYNGIAKAYMDYYLPQLNEQAANARRAIALNSTPGSSSANRRMSQFETDYQRQLTGLGEQAQGASNQARQNVESSRASLIQAAEGGSGLDSIGERAASEAALLSRPAVYSPLGDLFSRYTISAGNGVLAANAGYQPVAPLLFGGAGGSRGSGSVQTVNT